MLDIPFPGRTVMAVLALLFASGCAPDITETDFYSMHPDPDEQQGSQVVLVDHSENGTRLTLVADDALGWGFNTFRVEAADGWQSFAPMLVYETATERWSSPIAATVTDDAGVMYAVPPAAGDGQWFLEVNGQTTQGPVSIRTEVSVQEAIWVQPDTGQDLVVAWVAPTTPKTGTDVIELALYRPDAAGFLPVTDASLDLYPYMDMGGGEGHSTPYSAPVHTGGGRYVGEINFIMSGGWDLTVHITLDGHTEDILFHGFTVE